MSCSDWQLGQFAFGALPVAPLSEAFGRQPVYLVTLLVSSAFTLGTGASRTWAQVLVCRFFAGATGGEPFTTPHLGCIVALVLI